MREHEFRAMMDRAHPGHDSVWVFCSGIPTSSWSSRNGTYYGEIQRETIGEFIGRKDKNGKKVYEGDIIQYQSPLREEPVRDVIEWDDARLGFNFDNSELFVSTCEVIGNIHENAALLEL